MSYLHNGSGLLESSQIHIGAQDWFYLGIRLWEGKTVSRNCVQEERVDLCMCAIGVDQVITYFGPSPPCSDSISRWTGKINVMDAYLRSSPGDVLVWNLDITGLAMYAAVQG